MMFTKNLVSLVALPAHRVTMLALCVVVLSGIVSIANAELLYYDDINYATGDIAGDNNNSSTPATHKFSTAWTALATGGTGTVTASNLVTGSGNAVTITPTSGTTVYGRSLGDANGNGITLNSLLPTNNTLWFSSLVKITSLITNSRFLQVTLRDSSGVECANFGKFSGHANWGVNGIVAASDLTTAVIRNETKLLVMKMVLGSTSPSLTLWALDPTKAIPTEANLGTGATVSLGTTNVANLKTVNTIGFGAGYQTTFTTSVGVFDNLSIGTTYNDVAPIPEPASTSLLMSGAAGLLAYAWRKRK